MKLQERNRDIPTIVYWSQCASFYFRRSSKKVSQIHISQAVTTCLTSHPYADCFITQLLFSSSQDKCVFFHIFHKWPAHHRAVAFAFYCPVFASRCTTQGGSQFNSDYMQVLIHSVEPFLNTNELDSSPHQKIVNIYQICNV